MKIHPVKKIIHFLVFSHLFLALLVTAFYLGNKFLLTGKFWPDPYSLFLFFSTLFLYNVHRIYGLNKHAGNLPLRYEWAGKNLKLLYAMIAVSGLLAAFFANHSLKPHSFLLLFCFAAISFSYSFPIIPTANGLIRLKDIPLLKPFFISLVVTGVALALPEFNEIGSFIFIDTRFTLLFLSQFLFTLSLTFLFDIRDIEQDKKNNIRTLPVVYGIKKTQLITYICNGIYLLLLILMLTNTEITQQNYNALFTTGILSCAIIYLSGKFKHPIWYMIVADGMMGMQPVLLYFLSR